jgi:tetratricopeptide (TPR) repeat protein
LTIALDTLSNAEHRASYDAYLRDALKTRIARRAAEALEVKREWSGAAEAWARVVEALPAEAYGHHRLAYALLRSRSSYEAAIHAASRAIALDPTRAEYRLTAASLYLAAGLERMALAELEVACELEVDRPDIAGLHAAVAERCSKNA